MLIAKPVIPFERAAFTDEKVIIIDASASMLVSDGNETRFDRAINQVKVAAEETLLDGGLLTVIVANDKAYNLSQRANDKALSEITAELDELKESGTACTYGSADLKGAMELAENVLMENSEAEIVLYTATKYHETNGVEVVDVSKDGEWNAAVLDCTAKFNDNNHYEIAVEVGCFGRTEQITLYCDVYGANGNESNTIKLSKTEYFDNSESQKTITFTTSDFSGVALHTFNHLHLYVKETDSFQEDNNYYVYGGTKQKIKIQYASSIPNNFFSGAIRTIRERMKTSWDIEFYEAGNGKVVQNQGYDFYIYEHEMPDVLPTDGIVMLVDPNKAPDGAGFSIGDTIKIASDSTLATGATHEITKFVNPSHITLAKYRKIFVSTGVNYEQLAYYAGDPVIMVRNDNQAKIILLALDLNYSNLSAVLDFPIMMYNAFNYFIPSTFDGYAFEIGDTIKLNSRGNALSVSGNGVDEKFDIVPSELKLTKPGSYTTSQLAMNGETYIIENFFVKIPNYESNITKTVDALPEIEVDQTMEKGYDDLLLYFAIALAALLFVEWLLQAREHF
jgi:hypothetical protein